MARGPVDDVPDGYAVHRVGSTWLVLHREHLSSLIDLRLADEGVRAQILSRGPRRGRGITPIVEFPDGNSMVLRHYRHGGLFAALTRSWFWGPGRALEELEVTTRAAAAGAHVPRALCLVMWPRIEPFWSAVLGTLEERGAIDLYEALSQAKAKDVRELARKAGRSIRKLHDAGVEHRDLQLRNLLLTRNGEILVIDLDRARFHRNGGVPLARRASNLERLARSAIKTGLWGEQVDHRARAAFSGAYCDGDRDLRSALRDRIPRERVRLALHRLTYPLRGIR